MVLAFMDLLIAGVILPGVRVDHYRLKEIKYA